VKEKECLAIMLGEKFFYSLLDGERIQYPDRPLSSAVAYKFLNFKQQNDYELECTSSTA